ncbi:hypothetical protein BN1723_017919, partial [Verticillium longisporum]
MLCGENGSVDIGDFLDEEIKGPATFQCLQQNGGINNCKFKEPAMDDLILSLLGDASIELSCRSGECLHHTKVPGYERPRKKINTPLIAGVIAGCSLFLVAVILIVWYLSRRSYRYGAIRLDDSDDDNTQLMTDHKPASLYFQNVAYDLNGKQILANIQGMAHPGEVMAIMGASVKALNMLKDGKPTRNAAGDITIAASFQSRDVPNARIEPNRKWFGNTRVISQDSLNAFRTAMAEKTSDPYSVLLKTNKLPMSLIRDETKDAKGQKKHHAKMTIETSSFADTFGPKAQRKRVKIGAGNLADLADDVDKSMDTYEERREQAKLLSGNSGEAEDEAHVGMSIEPIFNKGQSKRIWNELYRVLDSSDVVIHVLDARDPLGTRCLSVEKYLREEAPHKHLIFVLNKTDLVPTTVAARWVKYFSKQRPTLAMHS